MKNQHRRETADSDFRVTAIARQSILLVIGPIIRHSPDAPRSAGHRKVKITAGTDQCETLENLTYALLDIACHPPSKYAKM
ncbi:hypothetical protein [Burkholderia plantarii]|uniref:hypothetical protein n=1 Tax=Burkholderia plantarii TaxID=41899 RepID=UPI00114D26C1|nr:hypothetical protein [Burkholderia plantarii]